MELLDKLAILADAAKYDASCASSGSVRRNSLGSGLGSTLPAGLCHSFTPDGRCISLFKVLLTNQCRHDCAYCPNRASADGPRAAFSVDEVVRLTTAFYRRNYVAGLFLSSGIPAGADEAMGRLVRVVKQLREKERFNGYIHLKVIPGADSRLVAQAARYADRLSANLELPTAAALTRLAPGKDHGVIRGHMAHIQAGVQAAHGPEAQRETRRGRFAPPPFAPAGQSTQLVVGADGASDRTILTTGAELYGGHGLRRVYYSAYSPVPGGRLSARPVPLVREHRLYQADWLLRFYGFAVQELVTDREGMLDLGMDPKLAWALAHREQFPVDVNSASREVLLRVPGLGVRSVEKILAARRAGALRLADLGRLRASLAKVRPFVAALDHHPGRELDSAGLAGRLRGRSVQLSLFDEGGHHGAGETG